MEIAFWASTDIGRVREHNEDNFLVDKRLRLFVVCDGMGGHAAGEVASAMSVRIVREVISEKRELIERVNETPEDAELRREILQQLEHAIQEANRRVFEAARDDKSRHGMGTTCVVLLLTNKKAFIAHVGDSRVYLLRKQQVHQLTEDHSLYNEMVRLGKIRPGEQIHLPNKNAVTRAVGVRDTVEVDSIEIDILESDRFLACSDGLCGYFKAEEQIRMMLSGEDVKAVTELCIAFALECGGKDNVTAIVVDVVKQQDHSRLAQEVEQSMELLKTVPYFQYLSHKERAQVMAMARLEHAAPGADVLDVTDDHAALLVIASGELEMRRAGEPPMRLGPGSYAGEVGFIDGQPHDFEVFARQESAVLIFERKHFMELLRRDPELAVKLLWNFLQMFSIKVRELSLPMAELTMFPLDDAPPGRSEDLIKTMAFHQIELAQPGAEAFPGPLASQTPPDATSARAATPEPHTPPPQVAAAQAPRAPQASASSTPTPAAAPISVAAQALAPTSTASSAPTSAPTSAPASKPTFTATPAPTGASPTPTAAPATARPAPASNAPAQRSVSVAPQMPPAQPRKVVIPAPEPTSSLNETTESREDVSERTTQGWDEPEEDLRATVQLQWGPSGAELLESDQLGATRAKAVSSAGALAAGPPPLPTSPGAAPDRDRAPTLPTPSGKLPPLPARPKKTPPPLGRGITGESTTTAALAEEEATQAQVKALSSPPSAPPALPTPPALSSSSPGPAAAMASSPFSLFDDEDAPLVGATRSPMASEADGVERVPPRAAVMKRGRRKRADGSLSDELSLSEESMPLGMREPSPGELMEDGRPPELVATVQLNLHEVGLGNPFAAEEPTKQLQRPTAEDLARKREPSSSGGPSTKVQVNFSLDDT